MADSKLTSLPAAGPLDGSELFYAVQAGADVKVPRALIGGRIVLTGNVSYYVSQTGSDSNDGLSSGTAWFTLQHASDYVSNNIDLANSTLTINVITSATTYDGAVTSPFYSSKPLGGGTVLFLGDITTPANVKVQGQGSTTSSGAAFYFRAPETVFGNPKAKVQGFRFVQNNFPAVIATGSVIAVYVQYVECFSNEHFGSLFDGAISVDGNVLIDAASMVQFWFYMINDKFFSSSNIGGTTTISGALALSGGAWVQASNRCFIVSSGAFVGTVTGVRFKCDTMGSIEVGSNGMLHFPGSIPGSLIGGGQYEYGFTSVVDSEAQTIGNAYDLIAPATGFTYTIPDFIGYTIINPAGVLATGQITMPPNPMDAQVINILTGKTITALTLVANSGQSFANTAPTTLAAGTTISAVFLLSASNKWFFF